MADRARERPATDSAPALRAGRSLHSLLVLAFYAAVGVGCFLAIRHALGPGGLGSVIDALARFHAGAMVASVACAVGIFAIMLAMEQTALYSARAPRAARYRPLTAFVVNAVALGSGFGMLSGGALRARLYAQAGIDGAGAFFIASAVTLMSMFGAGLIAALGLALVSGGTLPGPYWRWIGAAALLGFVGLLVLAGGRGHTLTLLGRRLDLPCARELSLWIALGAGDWLFSAAALFVLLPEEGRLPFPEFAAVFAMSHLAAMATGAPGGLGVFDGIMVSVAGASPTAEVAAALIVYRGVTFLAPVALGVVGLGALEARLGATGAGESDAVHPFRRGGWTHFFLQALIGRAWPARVAGRQTKGELIAQGFGAPPISLMALTGGGAILVLAPHPDDEVLGCGSLIAACVARGVPVCIAFMTDGRGSHLGSRRWSGERIAATRRAEAIAAAGVLGLAPGALTFLPNPDGALLFDRRVQRSSVAVLHDLVVAAGVTRIFTTWVHDPHPDHIAAALVARRVAASTGARIAEYPIWGRFLPDSVPLKDERWIARRLDADGDLALKRKAMASHETQTTGLIDDAIVVRSIVKPAREALLAGPELFLLSADER